jgi:hypothetical protein
MMAEKYPDHQGATIFYLEAKGEQVGNLDFGTHFNPRLA